MQRDTTTYMHFRTIADFELNFLEELLHILDRRLDEIDIENDICPDPDQLGQYDRSEYLVGKSMVACQTYLTEVMGPRTQEEKKELLSLGPRHVSGYSTAEIIHAGGNYVKHHAEPLVNKTAITILNRLGVWKQERLGEQIHVEYPMSGLLRELLEPSRTRAIRLVELLPLLRAWRDEIIAIELEKPRPRMK